MPLFCYALSSIPTQHNSFPLRRQSNQPKCSITTFTGLAAHQPDKPIVVTPSGWVLASGRVQPNLSNLTTCCVCYDQGGSNWQLPVDPSMWAPRFRTQQLMVLGVDVTHGLTGSKKPSVAAVVGSHDPACTRYAAAVSEQTAGHEVVLGMQESVRVLLAGYKAQRGQLPEAILVFRDGVSDSMYGAVVQHEVAAIRAACQEMAAGAGSKIKVRPRLVVDS